MDSKPPISERFVVDGHERLTSTEGYKAAAAAARRRVYARFAPQLAAAGPLRRLWLVYLRRRELNRELERLAPPEAFYLRSG